MDVARTWLPRGLATLAFCVYAVAAPSGFHWLDSAELSAAAVGLGSPHPTGFPLFCMLAKAAQLVPVGEMAFRLNLLSATAAALAVLWITRLCIELPGEIAARLVGAACAGTALTVSFVFARHATVTEVYAPNAALLAAALLLFHRVARGSGPRHGLTLAVVCGLGLGGHATFLWIGLPVAVLLVVRLYRGARWPLSAPLVTVLMAGALYMYLPVRSASFRIAPVDWGHPRTARALVEHVTARRIRSAFGDEMRSTAPEVVAHHASAFVRDMVDSMGPLVPLASVFGLIWLYRRRRARWLAGALTTVLIGDAVYSIWLNPMGAVDVQNGVPLTLGVCVAAGAGISLLAQYLGRVGPYAGAVASLVLVTPPALHTWPALWHGSSGDLPRALCEAGLDATPARGVALVQNDSTAAGLTYLTATEGVRPDVAVLVRQHLLDTERVRAVLGHSGMTAATLDDFDDRHPLDWIVAHAPAITWEIGVDTPPGGTRLAIGAPLSRLVRPGVEDSAGPPAAANRSDVRQAVAALERIFTGRADRERASRDRSARRVHAASLTALGRMALSGNDMDLAELLFAAATQVDAEHGAAWVNRGVVASQRGAFDVALEHTEHALDIGLGSVDARVSARVNAGRYAIQLGQDERAREHIERALAMDPERPDAWALAAVLDMRAGLWQRAREHLDRARRLDPSHPDVLHLQEQMQRTGVSAP